VHLGDKIRAQMWAEQPCREKWQGETLAIDAVAIARHWPCEGKKASRRAHYYLVKLTACPEWATCTAKGLEALPHG
jgi:hypothetical protein